MIAKVKMPIVKQPVRKGGTSEQGGAVIHSCESFKDKGVLLHVAYKKTPGDFCR